MSHRLICPECNEIRIKTPSGAVCPNGHGRLQAGVTEAQLRFAIKIQWIESLPKAMRINNGPRIKVADRPGIWRVEETNPWGCDYETRVRVETLEPQPGKPNFVIANVNGKARLLRRTSDE